MSPEKGTVEMSKLVEDALVVMGPVPEPVIMRRSTYRRGRRSLQFYGYNLIRVCSRIFPWAISWFSPTDEKLPPIVTAWAEKTVQRMLYSLLRTTAHGPVWQKHMS